MLFIVIITKLYDIKILNIKFDRMAHAFNVFNVLYSQNL